MNRTSSTLIRRLALATAGAAVAAALAGCTGQVTPPGGSASASAPSTSAAAIASASTPPSAASTPPASPTASASTAGFRPSRCAAADLRGTVGDSEGAAGSTILDLQLQNTGSDPCTLQGWPGVSFITASGEQIGAAADFDRGSAHQTVTLIPNSHAHASLKIAQAGNYPSSKCDPEQTTRLRVYPPGSKQSVTVTVPRTTACGEDAVHLLTVQALHATT